MGKKDPTPPAAPDPAVVAAAQTKSNIETANANAHLNRIDQNTPWGSQNYTETISEDGTPKWTLNTTLSPDQQKLLDAQNHDSLALSQTGQKMLGSVDASMSNPLDFSNLTKMQGGPLQSNASGGQIQGAIDMSGVPKLVGGDALYGAMKDSQDASYRQQTSRLDPTFGNKQHDLENQLTQQGIMRNTDAWNRATDEFSRDKNDAYQTAFNNSFANGNAAQGQLFNQGLAANQNAFQQATARAQFANGAQQQGFGQNLSNAQLNNQAAGQNFAQTGTQRTQDINELMTQRTNPLNELNALRSGSQVQSPTFGNAPQVNQAGTDIAGLTNQNYQNQMGVYNAQVGSNNALTGSLAQLGGSGLMAYGMLSDVRLKENIKRVGTLDSGLPVYTYNYIGDKVPHMGVMAQEVEQVMPAAVSTHASGYKQVHYGML